MILEEGGAGIEDTILFGKYQICQILGRGRNGTVFLAVHRDLEEYRAIKRVPKKSCDYQQFRREALILKEFRHPGIPIVYDLEEDSEYSYLIEEYLEGESLYDLVYRLGYLTRAKMIRYGIQICQIVEHLHSAGTYPILYLDLQPKNLLLCHETIKLIDFDRAASLPEANLSQKRYGTVGCAAPEQYSSEPLDERTDLYAIGVILYYLGTGSYPGERSRLEGHGWGSRLEEIIGTCLSTDRENRFSSAAELCGNLQQLEEAQTGVFKNNQLSSLNIALIGSKSGVGTTHLSIGLSTYLSSCDIPCIYEEKNETGAVAGLAEYFHSKRDETGAIRVRGGLFLPQYGETVKLKRNIYEITIRDYGTNLNAVRDEDGLSAVLLVCGGKWWELPYCIRALRVLGSCGHIRILFNHAIRGVTASLPDEVRKRDCFFVPYFSDPFQLGSRAEQFYRVLFNSAAKEWKGGRRRGFIERVKSAWRRIRR